MKRIALIASLIALTLAGCSNEHEGQVCTASHEEPYSYYIIVNKVPVPINGTRDVCDRWEAA